MEKLDMLRQQKGLMKCSINFIIGCPNIFNIVLKIKLVN